MLSSPNSKEKIESHVSEEKNPEPQEEKKVESDKEGSQDVSEPKVTDELSKEKSAQAERV